MHEQFNRCLLQEAQAGRQVIIVVDEAQNLDASVLETLRLLSDFETPEAKLLQIVLSGQPELADKLARPSLRQHGASAAESASSIMRRMVLAHRPH